MLENTRIYIPTYRRAEAQHSFLALPRDYHAQTTFVCDMQDAARLRLKFAGTGAQFMVHSKGPMTIAQKRAWIIKEAPEKKIIMLDDDLRWAYRPDCDPTSPTASTKLAPAEAVHVKAALHELSLMLDHVVHAGIGPRQGNNRQPYGWVKNTRMMYVLGYQPAALRQHCELGRIETREDMDYALQLLRKGYPNAVLMDYSVDQRYNAPGGASTERSVETSNADAEKLAALHPGLVSVVEKDYAGSVPRKEVIVQWKKAFKG